MKSVACVNYSPFITQLNCRLVAWHSFWHFLSLSLVVFYFVFAVHILGHFLNRISKAAVRMPQFSWINRFAERLLMSNLMKNLWTGLTPKTFANYVSFLVDGWMPLTVSLPCEGMRVSSSVAQLLINEINNCPLNKLPQRFCFDIWLLHRVEVQPFIFQLSAYEKLLQTNRHGLQ